MIGHQMLILHKHNLQGVVAENFACPVHDLLSQVIEILRLAEVQIRVKQMILEPTMTKLAPKILGSYLSIQNQLTLSPP